MRNILFLLLLSVLVLCGLRCVWLLHVTHKQAVDSKSTIDFRVQEDTAGLYNCSLYSLKNKNPELVGSISIVKDKLLAEYIAPELDISNRSRLPSYVIRLITVIKAINAKQGLDTVVMLGNLYVPVTQRGKKFAQQLLNKACQYCFDTGATMIALIPDPFEYENGRPKFFENTPDYETKKHRLVKLYQKCGFSVDKAGETVFMYRKG